jgi:hypothetical protein
LLSVVDNVILVVNDLFLGNALKYLVSFTLEATILVVDNESGGFFLVTHWDEFTTPNIVFLNNGWDSFQP